MVYLEVVIVVFLDDVELDDMFGDGDDFEGGVVFGVFFEEGVVFEGVVEFCWVYELV